MLSLNFRVLKSSSGTAEKVFKPSHQALGITTMSRHSEKVMGSVFHCDREIL